MRGSRGSISMRHVCYDTRYLLLGFMSDVRMCYVPVCCVPFFLCVMCYERLFYVPCAHVLRGTRLHAVFYVLCAYVLCALGGPFATVLRVCARQRQHV